MAKPAKPPEKPSPFNALLEMRRSHAEQSTIETASHLTSPTVKQSDSRTATGLAKSMDPEFMKFTTYVRKKTHRAIKVKLTEQNREMSDLVEELLSAWLQKENQVARD